MDEGLAEAKLMNKPRPESTPVISSSYVSAGSLAIVFL